MAAPPMNLYASQSTGIYVCVVCYVLLRKMV